MAVKKERKNGRSRSRSRSPVRKHKSRKMGCGPKKNKPCPSTKALRARCGPGSRKKLLAKCGPSASPKKRKRRKSPRRKSPRRKSPRRKSPRRKSRSSSPAVSKRSLAYRFPGQRKFGKVTHRVSRRGAVYANKGGKWRYVAKTSQDPKMKAWAKKWAAKAIKL